MSSFLYGGLQPIWFRVALDSVSILSLGFCISTKPSDINTVMMLLPILLTWFTAGLTNRWPLSFPMIPILLLQQLRRLSVVRRFSWVNLSIAILSTLLLMLSIALCIAFPPLEPPPVKGPHKVGVVDLYLPVSGGGHVVARILYPTEDESGTMPYVKPNLASEYLKQSIQSVAPPPINAWHWFLDNWKLIRIDLKQNAKPVQGQRFPLIAYSHGLGGSAMLYSHITRSMAANGYIVIAVDHTDGTNPVVIKKDGSIVLLDSSPVQELWNKGKHLEYTELRREQTELRSRELIGAAEALISLNTQNIPELEELGISFVDCLNTERLHVMGHSFGGATALTVAFRRPDLVHSVLAHEPMTDWAPDDVRLQLFPQEAMDTHGIPHTGGTGGRGKVPNPLSTTYHQMPSFFLFSQEWYVKSWASSTYFEQLFRHGYLGQGAEFAILDGANHNEFSDMCFLTPLWLARALKVTGNRNPIHTADEVADRSLAFLEAFRKPAASTATRVKQEDDSKKKEEL